MQNESSSSFTVSQTFKSKASKLLISKLIVCNLLFASNCNFDVWFCYRFGRLVFWGVVCFFFFPIVCLFCEWNATSPSVQQHREPIQALLICPSPGPGKKQEHYYNYYFCCHTALPKQFPFSFQVCTQANYSHTLRTTLSI